MFLLGLQCYSDALLIYRLETDRVFISKNLSTVKMTSIYKSYPENLIILSSVGNRILLGSGTMGFGV